MHVMVMVGEPTVVSFGPCVARNNVRLTRAPRDNEHGQFSCGCFCEKKVYEEKPKTNQLVYHTISLGVCCLLFVAQAFLFAFTCLAIAVN